MSLYRAAIIWKKIPSFFIFESFKKIMILHLQFLNMACDCCFNNTALNQSNSVKYLGVIIDSRLNFDTHIKKLAHRFFKAVGIMFKLKQYMPRKALQALLFPDTYPPSLWFARLGFYTSILFKKLITLQNKAVKLIGSGLYNDKASPFYSHLKF